MSINERLKEIIEDKTHGSVNAFEKECNVAAGTIAKTITNNSNIGIDKIQKILQRYSDINPNWLIKGLGNKLLDNKEIDEIIDFKQKINLLKKIIERDEIIMRTKDELIESLRMQLNSLKGGSLNKQTG
jgi:hypothetical protein